MIKTSSLIRAACVRFFRTQTDLTKYRSCKDSYTLTNFIFGKKTHKFALSTQRTSLFKKTVFLCSKLTALNFKLKNFYQNKYNIDSFYVFFIFLKKNTILLKNQSNTFFIEQKIYKEINTEFTLKNSKFLSKKSNTGLAVHLDVTGVQINRLISEIERLFGQPALINVRTVKKPGSEPIHFVFRRDFCRAFGYMIKDSEFTISELYDVFAVFGKSHDLKFLVEMLTTILNETPYPNMQKMISNFKKMIRFFWYFWAHCYKAAGLYLTLSGKLSWHLLTISRTVHLRLGKSCASTIDLNALYEYKEYTSDTGAYGLTIRFYSRSILLKK